MVIFGEFPDATGDRTTSGIIHVCLSEQLRGEEKKEYSCRFYLLLDVAAGSYLTSSRDIRAEIAAEQSRPSDGLCCQLQLPKNKTDAQFCLDFIKADIV